MLGSCLCHKAAHHYCDELLSFLSVLVFLELYVVLELLQWPWSQFNLSWAHGGQLCVMHGHFLILYAHASIPVT